MKNVSHRSPSDRNRYILAGIATAALLAGLIFHFPSALQDASTGAFLPEFSLKFPLGYLLTTPLSAFADMITYNSARQDKVLIIYLLLGYWAWRACCKKPLKGSFSGYAAYLVLIFFYLVWAILFPRPAARLILSHPDDLAVDFHSHTAESWDGRRSFSPSANRDWHAKTGYGAAFVTDHNLLTPPPTIGKSSGPGIPLLHGEELSLHDAHVVILGNRVRIDPHLYDENEQSLLKLFEDANPKFGALAIASLPEYWNHYSPAQWEEFAAHGLQGFEIATASPKALDFPPSLRQSIVDLCRRRNLFLAGASDNHGWGSTAYTWNIIHLPGHLAMSSESLEQAVIDRLRSDPFRSVQVIVRTKAQPTPFPWLWFDPFLGLWALCRSFTAGQTVVSIIWIWAAVLLSSISSSRPKKRTHFVRDWR